LPNCCADFATIPGSFDDLRIYRQVLSSGEIAKLFQAVPRPTSAEKNTVLTPRSPPQPPVDCRRQMVCAPCPLGAHGQPRGKCPCGEVYQDSAHRPCTPR